MNSAYPIQPHHINTTAEPLGFDSLINYGPKNVLWAFMQFWQHKGKWEPFTHEEFIAFISDRKSIVNATVKSGLVLFVEPVLAALLERNTAPENEKNPVYYPTHFVISTYFLHNPADLNK